ncbi:MAG: PQQ-binding-like beta-propeller repeat protein [Acidobacteria bacterium]|nr:PQQ-binding-like beta-propeller repeat protein [Acidobacteriota bacterium]
MNPRFASLIKKFLLTHALLLTLVGPASLAQNKRPQPPRQVGPSILVRWQGKPGVERYRLQLATDEAFKDIVFDQAVIGRQHVVRELPPGNYFWRVAPAAGETGAYSTPARVTLGNTGGVEVPDVRMPADTGGWQTATGDVMRPVPAQLRAGGIVDVVGVNAEGMIYAVDGVSGIALWTARYRPDARRGDAVGESPTTPFAPLVLRVRQDESNVVVAFDGGVRALRGDSGRELWRAKLEGRVTGGVAADVDGDGSAEVALVTANPERLHVLDGASGRVIGGQKLEAEVVGAPYPLKLGEAWGFALSHANGRLEILATNGKLLLETKASDELTTAPLVVTRGTMSVLVVGTNKGLTALSMPEMKILGTIVADDDSVRGTLSAADVDGDGTTEIVMVTKRGRVALVSTVDGTVLWYAEGATDAASATFADLNADGVLDIIVPGGAAFAIGLSGRDGSLIWKVEEAGGRRVESSVATGARSLVVAETLNGGAVLVGSDASRVGLRAVELPKGALKAAAR